MKKKISAILSYSFLGLLLLTILASVVVMIMNAKGITPCFFGYYPMKVITGSMEPDYPVGSVIIVKETDLSELNVGDVISFYSSDPDLNRMIVTHRIYEIEKENGKYTIISKGDTNKKPDPNKVKVEDILGRVVGKSRAYEILIRIISNRWIFLAFIVIPLIALSVVSMREFVSAVKDEASVNQAIENGDEKSEKQSDN